jgi:hypothetical protein
MQFVAVGEGQLGMGTVVGSWATVSVSRLWAARVAVGSPLSSCVGAKGAGEQPASIEKITSNSIGN